MQASPAFQHQVTSDLFSAIRERYSDNGYTNVQEDTTSPAEKTPLQK